MRGFKVVPVQTEDYALVQALLRSVDLPVEGVRAHFETFVKLVEGGRLVGTAGLEVYGKAALLRSVAVASGCQGRGYGGQLVRGMLERAREGGIGELFLLTETAQDFFASLGFEEIAREQADVGVQNSVEFQSLCPDSATCMRLRLG